VISSTELRPLFRGGDDIYQVKKVLSQGFPLLPTTLFKPRHSAAEFMGNPVDLKLRGKKCFQSKQEMAGGRSGWLREKE